MLAEFEPALSHCGRPKTLGCSKSVAVWIMPWWCLHCFWGCHVY